MSVGARATAAKANWSQLHTRHRMAPAPSHLKRWLLLGAGCLVGLGLVGGWWLGQLQSPPGRASQQQALGRQVADLQSQLDRGNASAADQQRLLELLIGLNRQAEATLLAERLADQQPERPGLRLVLAELRRSQNDRAGAEREVRQLLNQDPNNIQALQLMALLQVESGRGVLAISQLQAAFDGASKPQLQPQALDLGLLLANVLERQGQGGQAQALLVKLAAAFPKDPRPQLAMALLLHQRGDNSGAQKALELARQRVPAKNQAAWNGLATAWGLEGLAAGGPGAKAPSPGLNPPSGQGLPGRQNP
ncbi:lipopolysaccharide assembly protein LapB [Cyanobium sp. WAJ14-Wanaka]|uniref:tetratricopeptide repeat protein n=1 Tax=Cyanobium sp. WAJ14-Wanaka TaxID=2823725 RepID=UPI0020CF8BD5|nr:hypothetical protein [Cyanobium sp. WAJ14-Wanaka]